MKHLLVGVLLVTAVARADLNRTTGLIDVPTAGTLDHGMVRIGASASFSEDDPQREENLHLAIGLYDRAEISVGVLSREAIEVNFLFRVLDEGNSWPGIALGMWNITSEEHVSDPGFGEDAYADELSYGEKRPRELASGFCVLSKSVLPWAGLHVGFGRGRFVGWGPRSKNFKIGDQPNTAVGLFGGVDVEVLPGFHLLGELDGRDANLGVRYSRGWFQASLAASKLEHLSNSSEHHPRLVAGAGIDFALVKRKETITEEVEISGDLSGRAIDVDTWEPVAATVRLLGTDHVSYTEVEEGIFTLKDVDPGKYVVEVSAPGYESVTAVVVLEPGQVTEKSLFLEPEKIEPVQMAEEAVEKGVALDERIYFEFEGVDLSPESRATLERVAEKLRENPDVRVEIRGYTDEMGSEEFNLILSQNRAGVVKAYLVQQCGIDAARLTFRGYGEDTPAADNADPEGRSLNRRVEFKVVE